MVLSKLVVVLQLLIRGFIIRGLMFTKKQTILSLTINLLLVGKTLLLLVEQR